MTHRRVVMGWDDANQDKVLGRQMDWVDWHKRYEWSPALAVRLRTVKKHIAQCLDACRPGPIKMLSVCAGDAGTSLGFLPATHAPRT